jgi:hypothetical protein
MQGQVGKLYKLCDNEKKTFIGEMQLSDVIINVIFFGHL